MAPEAASGDRVCEGAGTFLLRRLSLSCENSSRTIIVSKGRAKGVEIMRASRWREGNNRLGARPKPLPGRA